MSNVYEIGREKGREHDHSIGSEHLDCKAG